MRNLSVLGWFAEVIPERYQSTDVFISEIFSLFRK